MSQIRQPIVTVAGHVDHGKTSILDCFRGSSVQEGESGGITQKISFTKFPLSQVLKSCPLVSEKKICLSFPGFLFIDTPGHAAFTNLRKRGGSLADLAILVVDVKEGIKPQTAEVLSILKANKTPFVVALNKVDTVSGWQRKGSVRESIESLPSHVKGEFDTALLTFQSSMQSYGFSPELFFDITDFAKHVAIVPCSARSGEGINELLFVIAGLSQRFLCEQLLLSDVSKGVLLEIKKDKSVESAEAILYDGVLREGDEVAIASFSGKPIISKVRCLEEIKPLSSKFSPVKEVSAASGVRLHLTNKQDVLSGMPFERVENNLSEITDRFKKEVSSTLSLDKEGVVIKADSLGSLEALITLLKQSGVRIVKAGIGPINKSDVISARANLDINPLDAAIVGFNVPISEDVDQGLLSGRVRVFVDDVVYKLIEDLDEWRSSRQAEIEKERLMSLATICKLQILPKFVFRNSNPAIFGVRIVSGILRKNLQLIDSDDSMISRVKAIQCDKNSVDEANEGLEVAISLPGVNFERQLADKDFLFSQVSQSQFREFRKNKDLLAQSEIKALSEIAEIKRRKKEGWGV